MTQEDKKLLTKDLCSRLDNYSLLVKYGDEDYNIIDIGFGRVTLVKPLMSMTSGSPLIEEVKPYLRRMKDMTDKEWEMVHEIDKKRIIFSARHLTYHIDGEIIDLFNERNIDWRGLIDKGLALEATEDMYSHLRM